MVLLQGIIAYVASLFWASFLLSSVLAVATASAPNYFPVPYQLFPVFPDDCTAQITGLAVGIVGLLVLLKLLIAAHAMLSGRAENHSGSANVFVSTVAELLLSSLTAPILLMYQSHTVIEVLRGSDGGWPASQRGEGRLSISESWAASGWIALSGTFMLLALWQFVPGLFVWMLPIGLPMAFAPLIIQITSQASHSSLFLAAMEAQPTSVILTYQACLVRWESSANMNGVLAEELLDRVSA